jgi:fibronectin-binding autotransporter adhesin
MSIMNSFFSILAVDAARRSTLVAVTATTALFAATAAAQSVSVYERVRLDIGTTANAANSQYIGSNPAAIAWNGSQLYVAGYNGSGVTGTVAITQVTNPLAAPGLGVVPTFSANFGQYTATGNTRGFTGLALGGTTLSSAWENGVAVANGVQGYSTASNSTLWTGTLSTRQMGGVAFDPGYVVSGSSQGGSGVGALAFNSGRRILFDVATGTNIYSTLNGMIVNTNPVGTEWRDVAFDPNTGDIFARVQNNVTWGVRTDVNTIANNLQTYLVNNGNNGASTAGQNIAFMSNIVDPAGSYTGNAVIWNNRPQGSVAGSSVFTTAMKLTTTGSADVPVSWNLLYGSTPANGNGWYDFGFDTDTQTLAVMDFINRTVSVFDLNVNVQTVASGTQTASLSGTTPLAKRGGGTLVTNQAGPIATNTVYVEEGTLQIGSGGTSGVIGSPVAVTVSSGANLVFNRSDNYGGNFANVIGGAGGMEVKNGALTVTAANNYTGGTLISGGTLSVGSGSTTGSLAGSVTNNGALVFNRSNAITFSGTIGGTGSLTKAGAGTLTLAGANTYAGPTAVAAGTLVVNGDQSAATGGVTVAAGATLAGTGIVGGATTVQSAATLAPGPSLGTLSFTGGLTWNGGGNYNWQLFDTAGAAGDVGGWDLASAGGVLAIGSTSADPFKINLWTLSGTGPDVSGTAANFDPSQGYTWRIASAAGGITGFAANKFLVNTSSTNGTGGFANSFAGGAFSVAQSGNDLNLIYTAGGTSSVITINVASGTQTQADAGYPTLSGSIPVLKTGAGTLVVDQANTLTGSTTVQDGVLQLANGSALSASQFVVVAGGTGQVAPFTTTRVAGLDLATGNGLLDVTSGALTISSGLTAPQLVAELIEGRASGSWTGTSGITSSTAAAEVAASTKRAVGWLDNGDGSLTVAYAAPGDTNLDWSVDILDAANFLAGGKFDTGAPATWLEGDFSYDGIVDILDAADFVTTGLYNTGNYNTAPGGVGAVAAVPEPSSVALAAGGMIAAVGWSIRRRFR